MVEDEENYTGLDPAYSCYCNNGEYNDLPIINLEIASEEIQFNLEDENYLFLPYLNYTVPTSLCILGLESAPTQKLANGYEYVSLGQRALDEFPFYAVFDIKAGSA